MEWYSYPLLIAGGFGCGFINILAGSGSLITLPILIFLGLPVNVANGTNRVAILFQNIIGVGRFRQSRVLDLRQGLRLAIPAVFGGILGAQIAVNLNERVMELTIGGLMIVMLVVVLIRPRRWLEGRGGEDIRTKGIEQIIVFFLIGIYGGFIQAGVGIFLLAGLVLSSGYNLKYANPVKILIILCFTIFALVIFILNDQVRWDAGLILAIGNMAGAWVATRMAVQKGAGFIRYVLIIVLIATAVKLFGGFEFMAELF
ncbi:MAG TPA: sulfite exporter TauE/SafE family protein [candidate division Zixibacteria bacterium]|nr:sulfite exporter TauE/SafE family protein [candidate division Zixibacteria bacterium]